MEEDTINSVIIKYEAPGGNTYDINMGQRLKLIHDSLYT